MIKRYIYTWGWATKTCNFPEPPFGLIANPIRAPSPKQGGLGASPYSRQKLLSLIKCMSKKDGLPQVLALTESCNTKQ
jgi:hypothetical protein